MSSLIKSNEERISIGDELIMTMSVPSSDAPSGGSKVIFIIEDNKSIRELLIILLGIQGEYVVTCATCGSEALAMMHTIHPDLLLLDYHLPDMTGLQLYDLLHAQGNVQPLPTIFMSATFPFSKREKRRFLFLPKPFHLEQLRELIKQALAISCL